MPSGPKDDGDKKRTRAHKYVMIEGETSSSENAGGNSRVLRTWVVRGGVEEDVEVTVAGAKDDAELHAAAEGVRRVARAQENEVHRRPFEKVGDPEHSTSRS